jgi:hypothetical protein
MSVVPHGLYTVSNEYFVRFKSPYLTDNKLENRPYYYAFRDKDGIIWLIPLSSQVESYSNKIARDERRYGSGRCLYYHIGKIAGKNRVFLIGNMFPVTQDYIKKEYTLFGQHYVVRNEKLIKEIHPRAVRYLSLVRDGKLNPTVDILNIRDELLAQGVSLK